MFSPLNLISILAFAFILLGGSILHGSINACIIVLLAVLGAWWLMAGQVSRFTAPLQLNFKLIRYFAYLAGQMMLSTFAVCRAIVSRDPISKLRPSFETLRMPAGMRGKSSAQALYGVSIILTPSTITVDLDEDNETVVIHGLLKGGATGCRELGSRISRTQR